MNQGKAIHIMKVSHPYYKEAYSEGYNAGVAVAIEELKNEFELARIGRPLVIQIPKEKGDEVKE